MKFEIRYRPAFSTLFVSLNPGDVLVAEAGAMASMDGAVVMQTKFFGGFFPALMKAFLGGESIFVNEFRNSTSKPLQVVLTGGIIGDMESLELRNQTICFQPGAYIAHTPGINVGVQWASLNSWFAGEGLFKLKLSGSGTVFFGAYGGITKIPVRGEFIVDTEHLVAYEPTLKMNIKMAGGLIGSITSGEGLVNRMTGNGNIYIQSRSIGGLVKFLAPKMPA